jgi:hypothetical protein
MAPAWKLSDIVGDYFRVMGHQRRVVTVPLTSKTARTFRESVSTSLGNAYGKIRWEEFPPKRARAAV